MLNVQYPQFICLQDDQNANDQSIGIIKEAKEWAGELLSGQTKVIVSCIQLGFINININNRSLHTGWKTVERDHFCDKYLFPVDLFLRCTARTIGKMYPLISSNFAGILNSVTMNIDIVQNTSNYSV